MCGLGVVGVWFGGGGCVCVWGVCVGCVFVGCVCAVCVRGFCRGVCVWVS